MGTQRFSPGRRPIGKTGHQVSVGLTGVRQVQKNFHTLTIKMQKKIARKAVSEVAGAMVKAVKAQMDQEKRITESPKTFDTGLLRASIGKRMWTKVGAKWVVGATVGPRVGQGRWVVRNALSATGKHRSARGAVGIANFFNKGGQGEARDVTWADPAKYGHLVEGGTEQRSNDRGANRGSVEKREFMKHTLLQSQDVMQGTMRTVIINELEREANKLPNTVTR